MASGFRSLADEADRTTISAESRGTIPQAPELDTLRPPAAPRDLSLKITITTEDKGQPWQSPTPAEYMLDLMLRMLSNFF